MRSRIVIGCKGRASGIIASIGGMNYLMLSMLSSSMQVEKQVYMKLQQGVRYEPLARRPKKEGKEFHFFLFGSDT